MEAGILPTGSGGHTGLRARDPLGAPLGFAPSTQVVSLLTQAPASHGIT